jgi:hypothetical protein
MEAFNPKEMIDRWGAHMSELALARAAKRASEEAAAKAARELQRTAQHEVMVADAFDAFVREATTLLGTRSLRERFRRWRIRRRITL